MGVIGFGVDLNSRRVEVSQDAADVGVEVGTDILTQSSFPVFGGENEMNVNLGERLSHDRLPSPCRARAHFQH